MTESAPPVSSKNAGADGLATPDRPWHALSAGETLTLLPSDPESGLSQDEAALRLDKFGPNQLTEEQRVTLWAVGREEITEPMVLLLVAVGIIYAVSGEPRDALAILLILAGIVFVEMFNEYRAKAAIASLQRLSAPTAPVIRDRSYCNLPTEKLVPGDLVLLRPGERVPADLRLLEETGIQIDESSLTGESAPVAKDVREVPPETELADRRDMAYAGTLVSAGKGKGVVVGTGMATELGRIAGLVRAAREPRTPLQLAMRQLAGWLVWLAIGFSLLVPTLGLLFGQPLREMVLTGLTLAFATIPEELPILITIVLGLGALRLARQRAIVKRLRAAETLGSVSAIAADKTGTITENHLAVAELRAGDLRQRIPLEKAADSLGGRFLLVLGALANDALIVAVASRSAIVGDPTDAALLAAAEAAGIDVPSVRDKGPLAEFTFDHRRKLMSAVYRRDEGLLVVAKGSPETVLSCCEQRLEGQAQPLDEEARRAILATAEQMAGQGLRVLALAYKQSADGGASPREQPGGRMTADKVESDLVFAGLAGLHDPPRAEVSGALAVLGAAGIRVLMLTGDHPATARAIATAVGIDGGRILLGRDLDALDDEGLRRVVEDTAVYARISPEHKLRIVKALQSRGEVVAVTGDGVNDAPALKEAAIGVAMGQTGTDVAKEAADIVLADDNFATVALAVREGRKLYENLRKAVRYYLAAKVALVSSSLIAVLAHLLVPFTPIQIIMTELFMDLGASVTFTIEPAEGDVMARPPRDPARPFMDRAMQSGIFAGGASLCLAVIASYFWAVWQGGDSAHAQTVAFATWMLGHVVLAFNMRSERQPLLAAGLFSNKALLIWALAAIAVLALSTNLPAVGRALGVTSLSREGWLMALLVPIITTSWWDLKKIMVWRSRLSTSTQTSHPSDRRP